VKQAPHVPVRQCIGCAQRAAQSSLLRLRCTPAGALTLVSTHHGSGRSAYLHPQPDCWQQFAARKGSVRSLGRSFAKDERASFVRLLAETLQPKSEVTGYVA